MEAEETENQTYGTGCRPSPPDKRDYPASAFLPAQAEAFPMEYRLPFQTPVGNQGSTSMCVDFSLRTISELKEWFERGVLQRFGTGYIYGRREADDHQGEGMYPREALDTLLKFGIPGADDFNVTGTYEECRAAVEARLPEVDRLAAPQKILSYVRCWDLSQIQGMLYHRKTPVLLASVITKTFMWFTRADGIVRDETANHFEETSLYNLGGHAMVIVGWKHIGERLYWIVQNSWGTGWGDQGFCYIPADWPGLYEFWGITDASPRGRSMEVTLTDKLITLENALVGDTTMVLDDGKGNVITKEMPAPALIINGYTYIPVRSFVNGLAHLHQTPHMFTLGYAEGTTRPDRIKVTIPDTE